MNYRRISCLLLGSLLLFVIVTSQNLFAGGSKEQSKTSVATASTGNSGSSASAGLGGYVGKLEGPTVVTDPAEFPKTFHQAPELATLVKEGKLPPVKDRIGEDPLVIKPLHSIGKYGGTLRRGYTGVGDTWSGIRMGGHGTVLNLNYSAKKVIPWIARGWKMAPDGKSLTLYLRRGMKWSDGQPFTADDFMFWYKYMLLNKQLFPLLPAEMVIGGKPVVMKELDKYTIKYEFAAPYYFFPQMLVQRSPGDGMAFYGKRFQGGYAPAHYLKQYLPPFVPVATLNAHAKAAGFNSWVEYLRFKVSWPLNPDLPVVTAWKTVRPANTGTWVLERNPYSIWVDTAGNQLPYIGKIVLTEAESLEVLNLRAMAGAYDYQDRNLELQKLPLFIKNQEKGGYKVHLDPGDWGADMELKVNLDYKKDPYIGKLLANVDFRRAFSLGINRDQINQAFWLGLGTPGAPIPRDTNLYFPGKKYRTLWHHFDPKQANQMLDQLGLTKKDAEGYRLRTDGKGRITIRITTINGAFLDYAQIAEMIKQQLKGIGIQVTISNVDRNLESQQGLSNQIEMLAWANDTSESPFTTNHAVVPNDRNGFVPDPAFAKWFLSGGKEGDAPPPYLQEALKLFREGYGATDQQRIELGKKIWTLEAEYLWDIGIVGLSPAENGLRVVKDGLENTPQRQYNSNLVRAPGGSIPEQFYWK